MLAGYGLGETSDRKIAAALNEFKSKMPDEKLTSFLKAVEDSGIEVKLGSGLSEIEPGLVGLIKFGDKPEPKSSTVFIDKDVEPDDLFFYLAHEVGHHFMHYVSGQEIPQFRNRSRNYIHLFKQLPREEQEADVFAYNLLMPEDKIRSTYEILRNTHGDKTDRIISELSDYFFTGKEFVIARLQYLGIA